MKKVSIFKNIRGQELTKKFTNANIITGSGESRCMSLNDKYLAAVYDSAHGGSFIVVENFYPKNISPMSPLVRAHSRTIVDLEFSPFNLNIIASASEDCTVKIWEIPHEGLTENINKESLLFKEHKRKVSQVTFNPVVEDLISSAAYDKTIKIENLVKGETLASFPIKGDPVCLRWDVDGKLVGATNKIRNFMMTIADPRANKTVFNSVIFENSKPSKFEWIDDTKFVAVGFSDSGRKTIKIFDIRKVKENLTSKGEIAILGLTTDYTVMTPYYNPENKLLYLMGKGEGSIGIYDLTDDKINPCQRYFSTLNCITAAKFPRRTLDYNKNEIDKFLRFTAKKELLFTSFVVPRRTNGYDPTVYPPVPVGEPALTYEQWKGGENKPQVKKEIHLIKQWNSQVQGDKEKEKVGETKKEEKKEEKKETNATMIKLEEQIKIYFEKVKVLQEESAKLESKNNQLKKKFHDLQNSNKKKEERLNELQRKKEERLKEKKEKEKIVEIEEKEVFIRRSSRTEIVIPKFVEPPKVEKNPKEEEESPREEKQLKPEEPPKVEEETKVIEEEAKVTEEKKVEEEVKEEEPKKEEELKEKEEPQKEEIDKTEEAPNENETQKEEEKPKNEPESKEEEEPKTEEPPKKEEKENPEEKPNEE